MARVRWRSAGYLAVFVVSALATYNSLQTLHGHARAGRHLEDEHVHHHHQHPVLDKSPGIYVQDFPYAVQKRFVLQRQNQLTFAGTDLLRGLAGLEPGTI